MNIINALIKFFSFIIKRKLYYMSKFFIMLSSLFFKAGLLITGLLNKINPDSFIFGVIFFALGFVLYGDKFKSDGIKKRRI